MTSKEAVDTLALVDATVRAFFTALEPEPGARLLVAVSGGIDSMVLMDVLARLRRPLGVELHVAHLDHGLRQQSADDSAFVHQQASQRGVAVHCGRQDASRCAAETGRSLEDAARVVRYEFLERTAAASDCRYIILGHHADDQAETVLLRLLRGSGSTGLASMRPVRDGRFLRPLLQLTREQILSYGEAAGVEHREDASNLDWRFLRNRVRGELLPQLREYNPQITRALCRTARLLAEEDDYLRQHAATACARTLLEPPIPGLDAGKLGLDVARLVEYHIAVQRRVLRAAIQGLMPPPEPLGFQQCETVLELAHGAGRGYRTLGNGLAAERSGGWLVLGRIAAAPVDCLLPVPGEVVIPERSLRLRARIQAGPVPASCRSGLGTRCAVFDRTQVGSRLSIRSPRRGELLQPHGMEGHKKLSDFLIDIKWPRLLRPGLLVLAAEADRIAWLVGLRTGHFCRVTTDTREIIVVDLEHADPALAPPPMV
jgi:tRNA(Ile)-lysidine synthase